MFWPFNRKERITFPLFADPRLKKIGIVVGHNIFQQGAINYLDESEYEFNDRIAQKIYLNLAHIGLASQVIYRPNSCYKEQCEAVANTCKYNNIWFSLHLHFNSASVEAKGCEALILKDGEGREQADAITDMLNEIYGLTERGVDGVKEVVKGERGHGMLSAVAAAGTIPVSIEPCFAHYRNKGSEFVFEDEDSYVDLLTNCLVDAAVNRW